MEASVIITTYNRPAFLKRAIESVLLQTISVQIIIVDDNGIGTDDQRMTERVVKEYTSKRVIYLSLPINAGACVARNAGVKIAAGKYIFFLDDDDEFLANKVKVQTDFLNSNLDCDGCLSAFKRIADNGAEICAESNYPVTGDFKNFVMKGNFFTPMLCIRKSSFEKSGGFRNIPRFQDRYFMLHCLKQKFHFIDIREELYIMHEHSGERVTNKSLEKSLDSLDLIKNFIDRFKIEFSSAEYQRYILKDSRMRATLHYIARKRIKSFVLWLKVYLFTKNKNDLLMALKSFFK